jgi:hypothetical protein
MLSRGHHTAIFIVSVNTKKWYRKVTDLWAELGDKIPFS